MTIGQIYFALVDPGEVFDDTIHNREDEDVFNLVVSQSEGNFALAEIEIRNPSEGLLSPNRKERCFISYQDGASVVLLFSGRIVGFPSSLSDDTINVEYVAQPEGWEIVQDTFLQTLKVSPQYNELFIAPDRRNDAAEILSGRSELLYWTRDTNAISTSDILEGSNFLDLGTNVIFDTVRTEIGDPPLAQINVQIEVQWEQIGVGTVDAGAAITSQFANSVFATSYINTLTPLAFEDGWRGVRIPPGYSVQENKLVPEADGFGVDSLTELNLRSPTATVQAIDFPTKTGGAAGTRTLTVPRVWYNGTLILQAQYQQKRRELTTSVLAADVQNFSLRGNRTEDLFVRLQNPTETDQGQVLDPRQPSFFYDSLTNELTTYGREAIEHGLSRASARLKKSARLIETEFEADLNAVVGIGLDHSIRFEDDRIPGGSIRGKVVNYIFSVDGDSGQQVAKLTLASVIGKGVDSVPAVTLGEVELSPVDYENEFGPTPMTSSIFYNVDGAFVVNEPVNVALMESDNQYLVDNATVTNDGETQSLNFNNDPPQSRPDLILETGTGVVVDLKSLNPEGELYSVAQVITSDLSLPKHLDMEAT